MPAWPTLRVALWIGGAVAAVALIAAASHWLHSYRDKAVEADRSASNAAAVSTARQADERAHAAADSQIQAIQQENDRARQAAAADDDPLAAGLRSLRNDTAR